MLTDAFATSLISRLSPELLAASLLVLASLCFFSAALVLLLVLRHRSFARPVADNALVPAPGTSDAGPTTPASASAPAQTSTGRAPRRGRSRLGRRRGAASLPAATQGNNGRDFSREIALAQQGSDAQHLMKDCGLTQLEANLVVKLYGHASADAPPAALG